MSPSIALKVLNLIRQPFASESNPETFGLSRREVELLEQLKAGLTYKQIGANLFVPRGTVQKHISNIYGKLKVNNKVEAVQKAIQNRLI